MIKNVGLQILVGASLKSSGINSRLYVSVKCIFFKNYLVVISVCFFLYIYAGKWNLSQLVILFLRNTQMK